MIFALVLLYQTTTASVPASPPKSDVAQAQAQTPATPAAAVRKPSEKPDVVCHKEFLTGSRVRMTTICSSSKSMEHAQSDFQKSLSSAPLAPRP